MKNHLKISVWLIFIVLLSSASCGGETTEETTAPRDPGESSPSGPPARLVSGAQSQSSAQWRAHSAVLSAEHAPPMMRSTSFELRASSLSTSTSTSNLEERP